MIDDIFQCNFHVIAVAYINYDRLSSFDDLISYISFIVTQFFF